MPLQFTPLDWSILGGYIGLLALAGYLTTRRRVRTADDYFLAGHAAPIWLVAVSVLSTVQSAATFLGVPDYSFGGDYAYLAVTLSAWLGALFVAKLFIPRFYAFQVSTVYELLEARFDATARRAAAGMYLVGRTLASGARLYLAAIAVSMIMFLDVQPHQIMIASFVLLVFGLAFTFFGGLNSVIWSDLLQVVLYLGAALTVLFILLAKIPAPVDAIIDGLVNAPDGVNKLKVLDWRFDTSAPFSVWAVLTGLVLLNIGNSGLDQDTTQRLLACKDSKEGARALYWSVYASVPVIALFLMIGSLLYVFYERPDLMGTVGAERATTFQGERITVFMHFILSEIPSGVRGLVAVGVIAAAAINSGLISMSAVAINDFYRPWAVRRGARTEQHFVAAGRAMTVTLGVALFLTAAACSYWQRATDTPLLEFVLGVMAFAYAGLLGVYFTAIFTNRGSSLSVCLALLAGFLTVLLLQPYVARAIGLPAAFSSLAFPWHLLLGTGVAFAVCLCGGLSAAPRKDLVAHA
jgi:solute:Na+ symporter, SSS family